MRSELPNTLISSLALPPASCITNELTFLALRFFIYIVGRLLHHRVRHLNNGKSVGGMGQPCSTCISFVFIKIPQCKALGGMGLFGLEILIRVHHYGEVKAGTSKS